MVKRTEKRQIEYAFKHYREWMEYIEEQYEDILDGGITVQLGVLGGGSDKSSKFENGICRIQSSQICQWCEVVRKTVDSFAGTDMADLIRLYYFERRSVFDVRDRLYISERTFYRWVRDICEYAYRWAILYRVLRP